MTPEPLGSSWVSILGEKFELVNPCGNLRFKPGDQPTEATEGDGEVVMGNIVEERMLAATVTLKAEEVVRTLDVES